MEFVRYRKRIRNIFVLYFQEHFVRDKRGKFIELANNRVNRTIKDIRLISNLSNRSAYEYAEDDVKKIAKTLQRELDLMKLRFAGGSQGADGEFSL